MRDINIYRNSIDLREHRKCVIHKYYSILPLFTWSIIIIF